MIRASLGLAGYLLLTALLGPVPVRAQTSAPLAASSSAADSGPAAASAPAFVAPVNVVLHTTIGDVVMALDPAHAPITTANFLRYVDGKRFDGISFYRAVKVTEDGKYGLVQGGLSGDPKRILPPIAHESPQTTGLHNVEGAVSMARDAPGSATAEFFIVIGDLSSLDGTADGSDPGYAVFGHVVLGLDTVKSMLELPRSEAADNPAMKGQMLAEPVKVLSVRRVD